MIWQTLQNKTQWHSGTNQPFPRVKLRFIITRVGWMVAKHELLLGGYEWGLGPSCCFAGNATEYSISSTEYYYQWCTYAASYRVLRADECVCRT